jgi:ubiquinol-cytochrome c reductase iron-sulfur subunit
MNDISLELDRRQFITAATSVTAGVGLIAAATPFIESFRPSARALGLGGPVQVDTARLEDGQMITVQWRGKPIYVLRRPQSLLDRLESIVPQLLDPESTAAQQPDYASNRYRAIRPEILVLVGICTHLGCAPLYRPDVAPADLGPDWQGGFFCPCHGSKFDLAGRVYRGVPAPLNLAVPPHRYRSESLLVIGEEEAVQA